MDEKSRTALVILATGRSTLRITTSTSFCRLSQARTANIHTYIHNIHNSNGNDMYVCKFEGAKCQSGIKAYLSATGTTVTSNTHRGGKEMIRTYATEKLFSPFCGDESVHAEDCIAAHRLPT